MTSHTTAAGARTARRNHFDGGEIEFVANNMDCHTRAYVIKTRRAAQARARSKRLDRETRAKFAVLADKMGAALRDKPRGWFDSSCDYHDRRAAIAKTGGA